MTKITRQNVGASAEYVDDVLRQLNEWGFSRRVDPDDWQIIREVNNDRERAVVAAAAIAEARINKFNARGRK